MREARDRLEQRTVELNQQINEVQKLNANLTAANKDLESFSSSVSHDLRSPLRKITSFSDLLQHDLRDSLNPDTKQSLTIINREALRMSQLIDDLLSFARIGRTPLRPTTVNTRQLVDEVIEDFRPDFVARDVVWKIDPLPEIKGDRSLLRQVLINLIDNALKFTRGKSPAEINIGSLPAQPDPKEVVIFIRDNGTGFDMQYVNSLFDPFQRLHTYEEFEGTGIGLANVQRVILRHGGRVWAEGEINKGATFYFALPSA